MVATSQHAESNSTSAQLQQVRSSKSALTAFILLKASSLSSVAQALELKRKNTEWDRGKNNFLAKRHFFFQSTVFMFQVKSSQV